MKYMSVHAIQKATHAIEIFQQQTTNVIVLFPCDCDYLRNCPSFHIILIHFCVYRFPFDVTTIIGYFGYCGLGCFICVLYMLIQATILSFFISCCLFLRALCFNFKMICQGIDELLSSARDGVLDKQKAFKQLFMETMEFHADIKK